MNTLSSRVILSLFTVILFAVNASSQTPAAVENELSSIFDQIVESGSYAGNYDEEKNSAANNKFREVLIKAAKRQDILDHQFSELNDKMFITTSNDGNLRIYSWDTNTGGTMRAFSTLFQFSDNKGNVGHYIDPEEDGAGPFYHKIFQVNSKSGMIYLGISTFTASTSLQGQTATAITISNGKIDLTKKAFRTSSGSKNSIGFSYDFFSVSDREERPINLFEYNDKTQVLRFPVVIEDDKTPQGRVTDKFISYKFNGTVFVRTK